MKVFWSEKARKEGLAWINMAAPGEIESISRNHERYREGVDFILCRIHDRKKNINWSVDGF